MPGSDMFRFPYRRMVPSFLVEGRECSDWAAVDLPVLGGSPRGWRCGGTDCWSPDGKMLAIPTERFVLGQADGTESRKLWR